MPRTVCLFAVIWAVTVLIPAAFGYRLPEPWGAIETAAAMAISAAIVWWRDKGDKR